MALRDPKLRQILFKADEQTEDLASQMLRVWPRLPLLAQHAALLSLTGNG